MAKNAAKKRRSGRRTVTKKLKNTFRYKKPDIGCAAVRELWDNELTAEANMAKMGLRQSSNRDIRPRANRAAAAATPGGRLVEACEVSRLFDVTDTADLKVIDRNYGRRPMSDEDQRYTAKLMAKHGLNQEAMAGDIKVNYNQLTLGQLRRMCDTFLSLGDDQRVVAVPERASKGAADGPASATADRGVGGKGSLGNGSKQKSAEQPPPMAIDTGEEGEGEEAADGTVMREEKEVEKNTKKKKKKKKKKKSSSSSS